MLPGVGFFGSGTLANILIGQLQEQGFHIVAIWAPNPDDALRLSQSRSIPFHSSVIDKVLLLPDVQLIVTACPPHYHNQIASKACGIGKHVICDWPPSHCIKDTITMRNAASNYPALITMFLTGLRFVPTFNIMRKLIIEEDFLGHIRLINASVMCDVISVYKEKSVIWDNHMGGGLLSLYGTNMIDIITYITGYRAHRVHGIVHCIKQLNQNPILFNTTEDFVNFQMELHPISGDQSPSQCTKYSHKLLTTMKADPIMTNVTLNGHHYNSYPKHEIYVYGNKGYLVCRDGDIYAYKDEQCHHNSTLSSVGETLIYTLKEKDLTKSSSSSLSYDSYVYPRIYLIGIRNMIEALKNAFFGQEKNQDQQRTKDSSTLPELLINGEMEKTSMKYQKSGQDQEREMIHWIKDPVNHAVNFDDGIHLQAVLEAIRLSSELREWIRIHLFD